MVLTPPDGSSRFFMSKNTRLIYKDDQHLAMYKAMPPEQFKMFMMAVLEYQYGDEEFANTIQDPMVKALFLAEKQHIDFNEDKWLRQAKQAQENGKKGGRPKKGKSMVDDTNLIRWAKSLELDTYPSRDYKFEEGWSDYFTNRSDAETYILNYLNNIGIHLSRIGR